MKRTMTIAVVGLTALLLAGCSASDPEEAPAPTTTSSSPSAEETTNDAKKTPEEPSLPEEVTEEDNGKGGDEEVDVNVDVDPDVQDGMFIMLTGPLESSKNFSDGERIALGRETCERIDSEDLQFQELADWVKQEGGFQDGAGGTIVSSANTLFCPESEIAQWDGEM